MGTSLVLLWVLAALICNEASSFMIRNKLLGKCLQAQVGRPQGRVSTVDCSPTNPLQEWHWQTGSAALVNGHTGQCVTAPAEQYEGVHLQPCADRTEGDGGRNGRRKQAWSCSKRGHLTLQGRGVHLIATKDSALVFLSKEQKQHGNRWLTLDNQTLCREMDDSQRHFQNQGDPLHLVVSPSVISSTKPQPIGDVLGFDDYQKDQVSEPVPLFISTKAPGNPTMVFFTMDYGLSWKITMLVLSSVALVLGTVILILNVYSNRRRKKVVCVLKSFSPREEVSIPGSPVQSERAPLTSHAACLPHTSPSLRGEILIEWKDGTVTPL
ncbi:uncharacterized protein si:dkey-245n4.2 isoform X1 [Gadus chalcogrammus]|uniref:uncharacterized protein si:dkey-245n4.2 isoform X1 n=2 Tax=Gadus chalcogrammus TaxID=1042646 RepID=UPI0024C2A14F|nr:uncharacterized protein si:dkey-245n4.2 isoform X1 [Gadus chalcogrammus]